MPPGAVPPSTAHPNAGLRSGALALWAVAALVCSFGCSSYSLVRYERDAAARPSVSIVTLENDSAEPGAEMIVSDALRREVLRRGGARLIPDTAHADWVIRGRVVQVATFSGSLSTVVLALEHHVVLRIELEAEDRQGKKLKIPPSALTEGERIFASADIEIARTRKAEALRRMAGTLAVRIHDSLDSAWTR